jgi:hypothetical protein
VSSQPQAQPMYPYVPNWAMYSRAPDGWHDEPFEYVFTFQQNFTGGTSTVSQANLTNQPLQLDPDADFFMRGIAVLQDQVKTGVEPVIGPILFSMRLRNAFGRPLDSNYIPMGAYAARPNLSTGTPQLTDPWQATPWYSELYFPANSALWADFQALNVGYYYSFHIYLKGVKRFQNEACKPGEGASTAKAAS